MRQIGREDDLEKINRIALKMAREVADDTGTLMAGGISNTNIYVKGDKDSERRVRAMFEEQVTIYVARTFVQRTCNKPLS